MRDVIQHVQMVYINECAPVVAFLLIHQEGSVLKGAVKDCSGLGA